MCAKVLWYYLLSSRPQHRVHEEHLTVQYGEYAHVAPD